jgi:hypothetical protein
MSAEQNSEIFVPISGFPGYQVSNRGCVRSCRSRNGKGRFATRWRSLRPGFIKYGYPYVRLQNDGHPSFFYVHRLVLEAFVGPCPTGMECCHGDGNPRNNLLSNLRWDTHAGNEQDAIRLGTFAFGERHGNAKLTSEEVCKVRALYQEGWLQREIAGHFNITQSAVSYIVNGKKRKHDGLHEAS